jgi:hypothetical protein
MGRMRLLYQVTTPACTFEMGIFAITCRYTIIRSLYLVPLVSGSKPEFEDFLRLLMILVVK